MAEICMHPMHVASCQSILPTRVDLTSRCKQCNVQRVANMQSQRSKTFHNEKNKHFKHAYCIWHAKERCLYGMSTRSLAFASHRKSHVDDDDDGDSDDRMYRISYCIRSFAVFRHSKCSMRKKSEMKSNAFAEVKYVSAILFLTYIPMEHDDAQNA